MNNQVIIVCDTEAERDFATALCERWGYRIADVSERQNIQVLEVEGDPPSSLRGTYARMGNSVWVVTALS